MGLAARSAGVCVPIARADAVNAIECKGRGATPSQDAVLQLGRACNGVQVNQVWPGNAEQQAGRKARCRAGTTSLPFQVQLSRLSGVCCCCPLRLSSGLLLHCRHRRGGRRGPGLVLRLHHGLLRGGSPLHILVRRCRCIRLHLRRRPCLRGKAWLCVRGLRLLPRVQWRGLRILHWRALLPRVADGGILLRLRLGHLRIHGHVVGRLRLPIDGLLHRRHAGHRLRLTVLQRLLCRLRMVHRLRRLRKRLLRGWLLAVGIAAIGQLWRLLLFHSCGWWGHLQRMCLAGDGVLHQAQHDLGLEEGLGQLWVLDQNLARLLRVLHDQALHLTHDLVQLRPRHMCNCGRDLLLRSSAATAAQQTRHRVAGTRCHGLTHRLRPLISPRLCAYSAFRQVSHLEARLSSGQTSFLILCGLVLSKVNPQGPALHLVTIQVAPGALGGGNIKVLAKCITL